LTFTDSKTYGSAEKYRKSGFLTTALAVVLGLTAVASAQSIPNNYPIRDSSGWLSSYTTAGKIDLKNPFFKSLGTNGRSCVTCHMPTESWSITPRDVQQRFQSTDGKEPIFRPVDGANCPSADVSTKSARKRAYSQLLSKGLIRVSLPVPDHAQFNIVDIQDPYSCVDTKPTHPAMFRRPLPSTNLPFLSAVMWDGRETVFGAIPGKSLNLNTSLGNQAVDATLGHAEGKSAPTAAQVAQIVAFETAISTAQLSDDQVGLLNGAGAKAGANTLASQSFYIGINDALGGDPNGAAFNSSAFSLFDDWALLTGSDARSLARQSVVRGQQLFNTLPIAITGVRGLNDALGQPTIMGTCTTCHDSPNVGNHSFAVPLAIGTSDYPAVPALDVAGLPVYTIECMDGTRVQVTDPGRALITGQCSDIGKMKGPVLRGLAGRAPYFHNGAAADLGTVVEFYNQRFNLNLTPQNKADLVSFLKTL
jgi:cytochrome c peroxidase